MQRKLAKHAANFWSQRPREQLIECHGEHYSKVALARCVGMNTTLLATTHSQASPWAYSQPCLEFVYTTHLLLVSPIF
jgi:hypothetical protein